ncbi:MAG: hypothetical protein EHM31_13295, partial [Candidatus Aminicenantes bacterium]
MKAIAKTAGAVALVLLISALSFAVMKPGEKLIPFSLKNIDGKDYTVAVEEGKLTLTVAETVAGETKTVKTHPDGILIDFWAT